MDKLLHLSEFSGKPKGCLAGQWKCTITLSTKLNTRCSFYFHYMCTTPKQNQSINQSTPTIFHSVIRTTDNNEFGYPVFSSYYHRRSFSDFSTAAAAFLQAQCCTWLSWLQDSHGLWLTAVLRVVLRLALQHIAITMKEKKNIFPPRTY